MELVEEEGIREITRQLVCELTDDILAIIPAAQIEEIGSTAIPGTVTKGDVDILVLVSESMFAEASGKFSFVYEVNEMPGIEFFKSYKGCKNGVEFGIQLSTPAASHFDFIAFRDILNKSPGLVAKYNEVKMKAAKLDEDQYRARKNEFIEMILKKYK